MQEESAEESKAESRQFSLDPLVRDDEVRQAYQLPFPTSIPVIYQFETIAAATLYGSSYVYTLPREVERRVANGAIEINLGRDLIDFGAAAPRAWEPRFIAGDTARLRSLGWAPQFTLDQGLDATIAWWREQRR